MSRSASRPASVTVAATVLVILGLLWIVTAAVFVMFALSPMPFPGAERGAVTFSEGMGILLIFLVVAGVGLLHIVAGRRVRRQARSGRILGMIVAAAGLAPILYSLLQQLGQGQANPAPIFAFHGAGLFIYLYLFIHLAVIRAHMTH